MFRYYSSYALVLSSLTHLICCGIPIFLSLSSFFVNLVFFESLALDFEFLEATELYLFIFTSLLFLVIIFMEVYNKKICCASDVCSSDPLPNSTKKPIKYNIIFSSILYILNTSIFISEYF